MDDDPEQLGLRMSIDIDVVSPMWSKVNLKLPDLFQKWSLHVGRNLSLNRHYDISVVMCNDDYIFNLNRDYRQQAKPTNILSFPSGLYAADAIYPESYIIPLGDVVISYDTLWREALAQSKSFQDHLCHLWIHGLLHLLGYDHEQEDDAALMENTEIVLLKHFNIANPYQHVGDNFSC